MLEPAGLATARMSPVLSNRSPRSTSQPRATTATAGRTARSGTASWPVAACSPAAPPATTPRRTSDAATGWSSRVRTSIPNVPTPSSLPSPRSTTWRCPARRTTGQGSTNPSDGDVLATTSSSTVSSPGFNTTTDRAPPDPATGPTPGTNNRDRASGRPGAKSNPLSPVGPSPSANWSRATATWPTRTSTRAETTAESEMRSVTS